MLKKLNMSKLFALHFIEMNELQNIFNIKFLLVIQVQNLDLLSILKTFIFNQVL